MDFFWEELNFWPIAGGNDLAHNNFEGVGYSRRIRKVKVDANKKLLRNPKNGEPLFIVDETKGDFH